MTNKNVRFPKAPNVDIIILSNTFIVVQLWASLSTRIWREKMQNNEMRKLFDLQGTKIENEEVLTLYYVIFDSNHLSSLNIVI